MTDAKQVEFLLARIEELKDEIETLHADYLILFWEVNSPCRCGCNCTDDAYQGA